MRLRITRAGGRRLMKTYGMWRIQQIMMWWLSCGMGVLSMPWSGLAAVPQLIRYQGQAMDSQGVPLEGPYNLTFRLYDAATGGNQVWMEPHQNVPLTNGHFSVLLGQSSGFQVDWTQPLWLSTQINSEPELLPRQQITSVPLALVAEQLSTPVNTSTIADDAKRLVPSGAIILWTGSGCPEGYTRLSALDGRFLAGGSTYNAAAGGSTTHNHDAGSYAAAGHTHSGTTGPIASGMQPDGGSGDRQYSLPSHTHNETINASGPSAISGTSSTADHRPPFATLLLCQKD